VYISTQRTGIPGILATFDTPVMDTNLPKRSTSVISQQALVAMNNPFMHESSEALRDLIESEGHETFEERLNRIWMLAYSRYPTDKESSSMRAWVQNAMDVRTEDRKDPWKTICHSVLSSNEFLYLD
jgi:hypothetical protein